MKGPLHATISSIRYVIVYNRAVTQHHLARVEQHATLLGDLLFGILCIINYLFNLKYSGNHFYIPISAAIHFVNFKFWMLAAGKLVSQPALSWCDSANFNFQSVQVVTLRKSLSHGADWFFPGEALRLRPVQRHGPPAQPCHVRWVSDELPVSLLHYSRSQCAPARYRSQERAGLRLRPTRNVFC